MADMGSVNYDKLATDLDPLAAMTAPKAVPQLGLRRQGAFMGVQPTGPSQALSDVAGLISQKYGPGGVNALQPVPPIGVGPAMAPAQGISGGVPTVSQSAAAYPDRSEGGMPAGTGAIVTDSGQSFISRADTPNDGMSGTHIADAAPAGVRPQQAAVSAIPTSTPIAVNYAPRYSPGDTSDHSFGGMYAQGLRMKQDRAYAAMNDEALKTQLQARSQDITSAGQNITGAADTARNQIAQQQLAQAAPGEEARAAGLRIDAQAKLQEQQLLNKYMTAAPGSPEQQQAFAAIQASKGLQPPKPVIKEFTDATGMKRLARVDPATGKPEQVDVQQTPVQKIQGMAPTPKEAAQLRTMFPGNNVDPAQMVAALEKMRSGK